MIHRFFSTLLLLTLVAGIAWAESPNPFTSSGGPSALSSPPSRGIVALAPYLRSLTDRLVELAREIHDTRSPGILVILALVSLLYGVFHALGPGHGKTIVSTYFLSRDAKISQSLAAGYLIALVHAVSAITMVLGIYYIVRGFFSSTFEDASRIVQGASFAVIAVLGAWMLFNRIRGKEHSHGSPFGHRQGEGHHHHGHEDHVREQGLSIRVRNSELFGIAVAAGLVPCPGASAILLVCISLGLIFAGVLSVAMISLGMGLTVSTVAAMAILAKRGVVKVSSSRHANLAVPLRRGLEIGGAALLFLFGLVLFIAQFLGPGLL